MKKRRICWLVLLLCVPLVACKSNKNNLDDLIDKGYQYEVILDGNGGMIGNYSTRRYLVAYNSLIIPPGEDGIPAATKAGYTLKGWYTGSKDEDGTVTYEEPWDFSTDKITESITLYAYWTQTYRVFAYYGENNQEIRDLADLENDTDILNAPSSSIFRGYTLIDYYYDEALTEKVEFGKEIVSYFENSSSRDLYLYTDWLEGRYTLVSEASQLKKLAPTTNYYLLNDIDCAEEDIFSGINTYSGIFDGAGHTIKNMKITQIQAGNTEFALFKNLENATIKNIVFDGMSIDVTVNYGHPEIAFVAGKVKNSTFEDVHLYNSSIYITIDGSITSSDIFTGILYRSKDNESVIAENCTEENNQIIFK